MAKTTNSMMFIVDNVQYNPDTPNPEAWLAEKKGDEKETTFPEDKFDRYHTMCFDYVENT